MRERVRSAVDKFSDTHPPDGVPDKALPADLRLAVPVSDERVAGNGGAILTISILVTRGLLVANQVALVIPGAATLAVLFALVEWEPLIDAGLVLVVPLADRKPGEPQWADLQATARLENRMLTVGLSGDPATNQAITLIRTGFADPSLGRGDEIRQAAQEVNQGSSSIAVRAITILGFINVLHQVGLGLHACVRNPNALDFASLSEAHDQVLPMILGERGGPAEYFLADSHDRFSYLPKLLSLAVPDINPRVSDLVKLHRAGGLQYLREAVEDAIYHIRLLDERLLFDRWRCGSFRLPWTEPAVPPLRRSAGRRPRPPLPVRGWPLSRSQSPPAHLGQSSTERPRKPPSRASRPLGRGS